MTKEEFKNLWESGDDGGGITFDDIAKCAKDWGLFKYPRICPLNIVRYRVLKSANTVDAEKFNPKRLW